MVREMSSKGHPSKSCKLFAGLFFKKKDFFTLDFFDLCVNSSSPF